jgi:tetratricopeptide (TPR) repeat protein
MNVLAKSKHHQGEAKQLLWEWAQNFARDRQYQQAMKLYQAFARKNPTSEVYLAMARIENIQGHTNEARTLYEKALSLNSKNFHALVELARLYERIEEKNEAIRLYETLIQAYPDMPYPYRQLAKLLASDPLHKTRVAELNKKASGLEQKQATKTDSQTSPPWLKSQPWLELPQVDTKPKQVPQSPGPKLPTIPRIPKLPHSDTTKK